ncbi:hypothetical protein EV2_035360 [Malus domestica]
MLILVGIPLLVSPGSLEGYSKVQGIFAGPNRFFNLSSLFIFSILASIASNFFLKSSEACRMSASVVHSAAHTVRDRAHQPGALTRFPSWPFQEVSAAEVQTFSRMPCQGLFSAPHIYYGVPSFGMNRRLMVGRFGTNPPIEY